MSRLDEMLESESLYTDAQKQNLRDGAYFWLGVICAHGAWGLGWVLLHLRLQWVEL